MTTAAPGFAFRRTAPAEDACCLDCGGELGRMHAVETVGITRDGEEIAEMVCLHCVVARMKKAGIVPEDGVEP
jgi:hypothetical protein